MSNNQVSLGDDLLVEILTKLPLKSLYRSKCVSKSWQRLISDYVRNKLPLIVSAVLQHSDFTYISTSDTILQPASLDFFPFHSNSMLIDCCNGLLLFYTSLTTNYHVCNPTTRKYVSLPKPSKKSQVSIIAFDPCHSQHFKVANFTNWNDQGANLELFDSASGDWVDHTVNWEINNNSLSSITRYTNGTLYILARPNQTLAIDLDTMICNLIELPRAIKNECYIGELGGWLHYSVSNGDQVRVWMLKDREKGEWMLKHCVRVKMGRFWVVALHPEREVAYLVMDGRKLVAYDVCEERVESVWELREGEKGNLVGVWLFPFTRFMEDSLASGGTTTCCKKYVKNY